MTPTQVGLIRESWAAVEPIADTAAGLLIGAAKSAPDADEAEAAA